MDKPSVNPSATDKQAADRQSTNKPTGRRSSGRRNQPRKLYGKQLAKRLARQLSVQALYQWQLNGNTMTQVELDIRSSLPDDNLTADADPALLLRKADLNYFLQAIRTINKQVDQLDKHFSELLDRPLVELDPIELAILRLASYELSFHPETPYRVVINEAVELAKIYGATASHRYINGVVDKLAQKLRKVEVTARQSKQQPNKPQAQKPNQEESNQEETEQVNDDV